MKNICLKVIDTNNQINAAEISKKLNDEGFSVVIIGAVKSSNKFKANKYAEVIVVNSFESNEYYLAKDEIQAFLKSQGAVSQGTIICCPSSTKELENLRRKPLETKVNSEELIYTADKIIKPYPWRADLISERILAALYGGIGTGSIDSLILPQFEDEKLFLPCRIKFQGNSKEVKFIGATKQMRDIFHNIEKKHRNSKDAVLILGETGTGKEFVASSIHNPKPTEVSMKKFIDANISEFSEDILESELFGHAKGAFTGAITDKKGLLETSDNETVFLDEIGDLPIKIQVKLLRVLNNRQFRRMGDIKTDIPFEGRLICATHQNLFEMMIEKKFREDFYYRIAEEVIEMPPLRERKSDLEILAKEFYDIWKNELEEKNEEINFDLNQKSFDEIVDLAILYDFPGNVRSYRTILRNTFKTANNKGVFISNWFQEEIIKERNRGKSLIAKQNSVTDEKVINDFKFETFEEVKNRADSMIGEYCYKVYLRVGNWDKAIDILGASRGRFGKFLKIYRNQKSDTKT